MKNMKLPDISYQRGILPFWDYIFMNITWLQCDIILVRHNLLENVI
jgi:hypothetical protein